MVLVRVRIPLMHGATIGRRTSEWVRIPQPSQWNVAQLVEHTADNRAVTSSSLVVPIPLYGEIQNTESWQSGNAEDC